MSFITKFTNKKAAVLPNDPQEEYYIPTTHTSYSDEIKMLKERVSSAYDNLDNVVDPLLIDSWIYEINAAQLRYQFCLQQLKQPLLEQEKTGVV